MQKSRRLAIRHTQFRIERLLAGYGVRPKRADLHGRRQTNGIRITRIRAKWVNSPDYWRALREANVAKR
jgi:hypothetical protein